MASTLHWQAAIKTQKRALRKNVGAILNQLSSTSIEDQSRAIAERVLSLPSFQRSQSVSCYLSMPSGEARTTVLVDAILRSGKILYVPKIQSSDGTMDFLRVYSFDDLSSLPSGTWGINEPGESWEGGMRSRVLGSASDSLDLILLPGVAFDRGLSRLGHGKGYYDQFISACVTSARPKPLLVGLSLREQLLNDGQVPMTEHDWKLDVLVTPDETLDMETLKDAPSRLET
ncbi:hypothetical protein GALMADRAFT_242136 [Galerina marginata CBS 339.88]|uniref:5-formyltetrahydrofolate cyclo-ligase n=1 Tax=Galerina marginata (strain CBS 339.88) TaxID=685588 RepID=A0A067TCC3_GALM3|nr:hypothetical protein GALMADRAFT_242136 [Galerina marginata CBS 339.88]